MVLKRSLNLPDPAFRDIAAAGYVLHNIYGALENIFEQISRTFENHVTDPTQWHRELLTKMFLEIPKIRAAVLPADLRGFLNDLRGFRHVLGTRTNSSWMRKNSHCWSAIGIRRALRSCRQYHVFATIF